MVQLRTFSHLLLGAESSVRIELAAGLFCVHKFKRKQSGTVTSALCGVPAARHVRTAAMLLLFVVRISKYRGGVIACAMAFVETV